MMKRRLLSLLLTSRFVSNNAFTTSRKNFLTCNLKSPRSSSQLNFFGDILKDAFTNDPNLSSDKTKDQLEYDDSSEASSFNTQPIPRTQVQKEWASRQKGAPVNPEMLKNTRWKLSLYLAGVPDRDPSNDLYGSRINISSRDRSLQLGVSCPDEPSVEVDIELLEDGSCRVEETQFTSDIPGEYKLSPDNQYLRFSLSCTGYQRTVRTTGSIEKIYWSEEDERTTKTSSTYSIPEGLVYCDVRVGYGGPGEILMSEGVIRFEKRVGFVGNKMVNCGRLEGKMIREDNRVKKGPV